MRARLEGLAGECSDSYALDRRPVHSSSRKVVLFDRARSFGRDAGGSVREEWDTRLASQISRINPGDQWVTGVTARLPSRPLALFQTHQGAFVS